MYTPSMCRLRYCVALAKCISHEFVLDMLSVGLSGDSITHAHCVSHEVVLKSPSFCQPSISVAYALCVLASRLCCTCPVCVSPDIMLYMPSVSAMKVVFNISSLCKL